MCPMMSIGDAILWGVRMRWNIQIHIPCDVWGAVDSVWLLALGEKSSRYYVQILVSQLFPPLPLSLFSSSVSEYHRFEGIGWMFRFIATNANTVLIPLTNIINPKPFFLYSVDYLFNTPSHFYSNWCNCSYLQSNVYSYTAGKKKKKSPQWDTVFIRLNNAKHYSFVVFK